MCEYLYEMYVRSYILYTCAFIILIWFERTQSIYVNGATTVGKLAPCFAGPCKRRWRGSVWWCYSWSCSLSVEVNDSVPRRIASQAPTLVAETLELPKQHVCLCFFNMGQLLFKFWLRMSASIHFQRCVTKQYVYVRTARNRSAVSLSRCDVSRVLIDSLTHARSSPLSCVDCSSAAALEFRMSSTFASDTSADNCVAVKHRAKISRINMQ